MEKNNGPDEPREDPYEDLPEGVPEPPDLKKVHELRAKIRRDQRHRPTRSARPERTRQARDIGLYTIIPMMMIVGPAMGYLLGMLVEKSVGGAPWPTVGGVLFGLVAAFRQIYIMLMRRQQENDKSD